MKPAALLSVILLGVFAIGHLLRLVFRVEVTAAGTVIPMWASVIACLGSATLATALWRESRAR